MTGYTNYFEENLYPLQNGILKAIDKSSSPFYLTGGTALSRAYLQHRYCGDLDLFVNDDSDFSFHVSKVLNILRDVDGIKLDSDPSLVSHGCVRTYILSGRLRIKIDFVNDDPVHFGDLRRAPFFSRIDSLRNIAVNKLTALIGRSEVKDIADLWAVSRNCSFNWGDMISHASEKEACIDVDYICGVLENHSEKELEELPWRNRLDFSEVRRNLSAMCEDMIRLGDNSLAAGRLKKGERVFKL